VLFIVLIVGAVIAYRRPHSPVRVAEMKTIRLTNNGDVMAGAISPDGKYVAYSLARRGGGSLWLKQIATGTTINLRSPADVYYLQVAFSPDGNHIYYGGGGAALNQLPVLGGEPTQIATGADCFAISPDAKFVAVRRLNVALSEYSIAIVAVDHSSERVVLRRRYPEVIGTGLSWSSDRTLAFFGANVDREDGAFLSELDVTNGEVKRITRIDWPGRHWFRSWTSLVAIPDGSGWIISNIEAIHPQPMWLVPRAGSPRRITSDVASYSRVTITADGGTIAACRADSSSNVWIVPTDASAPERALTTGPGNLFGRGGARWLSDSEVMFTDAADGKVLLRAFSITSGAMRELTSSVMTYRFAISPDRTKIAFLSDTTGSTEVWTSNIDGRNARQLSHDLVLPAAPSWFPDSRSVAYASGGKVSAIWKRSIDQQQPIRLTNVPATNPEISPDGTLLLCRLQVAETSKVTLLGAAGDVAPRYFDFHHYSGAGTRWMPDQTAYLTVDTRDGVQNIFMQPVGGGEPRQITHFQSRGTIFDFDISRDGKRIVLSRDEPSDDMVLIRDFR